MFQVFDVSHSLNYSLSQEAMKIKCSNVKSFAQYLAHYKTPVNIPWWKWKCYFLSCVQFCDSMDCSLPAPLPTEFSSKEYWMAICFSRGSSRPKDRTHVSHTARRIFTIGATREAVLLFYMLTAIRWVDSAFDCGIISAIYSFHKYPPCVGIGDTMVIVVCARRAYKPPRQMHWSACSDRTLWQELS